MKRTIFKSIGFLGLLTILLSGLDGIRTPANAQGLEVGVRVGHAGFFYSALRPYGEWIQVEPGFYAWRPVRVRAGWRPYLNGRWSWTEYGWYWDSYEPFGWATFHYGRWYRDDYYGWVWIPDDVWGPAWVEWRYDNDYIGWAPLPPYASFNISIGIRFTTRWAAPYPYWSFVRYGHFGAAHINTYVLDSRYTRRLIHTTRTAVRYEVDRDRIVNRGVDRAFIERRGNLRINRTEVIETRTRNNEGVRRSGNNRIEVYRPSRSELNRAEQRIEARRSGRGLSLDMNRIERNRSTETIQRREGEQRTLERGQEQRNRQRQLEATPRRNTNPSARQAKPERRTRDNEFRMIQPNRPTIQRTPERRERPTIRPTPRRDDSPQRQSTGRRGRDR